MINEFPFSHQSLKFFGPRRRLIPGQCTAPRPGPIYNSSATSWGWEDYSCGSQALRDLERDVWYRLVQQVWLTNVQHVISVYLTSSEQPILHVVSFSAYIMKLAYLNEMQCTVNIAGTSCAKLACLGESPTFPDTRMLKTSWPVPCRAGKMWDADLGLAGIASGLHFEAAKCL